MSQILSGFADDDEEDYKAYRRCMKEMFDGIAFNMRLVESGLCKMYIKDMNENEFGQYRRLLSMLKNMSDTPD